MVGEDRLREALSPYTLSQVTFPRPTEGEGQGEGDSLSLLALKQSNVRLTRL